MSGKIVFLVLGILAGMVAMGAVVFWLVRNPENWWPRR